MARRRKQTTLGIRGAIADLIEGEDLAQVLGDLLTDATVKLLRDQHIKKRFTVKQLQADVRVIKCAGGVEYIPPRKSRVRK